MITKPQLKTWLMTHGFTENPSPEFKGRLEREFEVEFLYKFPVRVRLGKRQARIDHLLKEPVVRNFGWREFRKNYERISGAYYLNLNFDQNDVVDGLGFSSNPRLFKLLHTGVFSNAMNFKDQTTCSSCGSKDGPYKQIDTTTSAVLNRVPCQNCGVVQ